MQFVPVTVILAGSLHALAADWPQYLGPNGDVSSPETIRTNWSENPPKEVWRKPIGPGFSSMAVSGGRVFTLARRSENGVPREFCLALDANTGSEIWSANVDAADYTNLSGYDDNMDGPRSTPTVEGDRVYVFTSQLKLFCLAVGSGSVIWQRDFRAEFGSSLIAWENSASPLLVGELIYVNANASGKRLMAIRKSDGTTAWGGQDDGMTHATPVFARSGGMPQVIYLTHQGLAALAPETGDVLWRLGFSPSSTSTAASPAVSGEYVYASAAYGSGTWMARVAQDGGKFSASPAWRQQGTAYQAHWSTPVTHDGFMYCVPAPSSAQGRLTCLDVVGGSNRWAKAEVGSGVIGYGSLIKAGNVLVVLTEEGELVLVEPNPAAYSELGRFKVLNRYCWNHPALSAGRLYARSTSLQPEIVALDVSGAAPPASPLTVAAERLGTDAIKLTVTVADPALFDPAEAADLELLSSASVTAPMSEWPVLPQTFAAADGAFVATIPITSEPAQYLVVRRKGGGN